MAKGVELASAYVSLSVNTSGIPQEIKKALNAGGTGANGAGNKVGSDFAAGFGQNIEAGMTKAVKLGVTAAAGVATAAVGGLSYTLFKGFDRYKSLDATNKRLRAMGKSGDQVKGIIADINAVVEGTPISLDAAAASATQFLSGGVREGKELKNVLTSIADAAGFSGQSYEDLALIFGQVMNKGKLQAEEMLQLNERNIPIQQWLQKELGVTGQELQRMSQDGQISFQNLVDAVESNAPGMAKSLGDTVDGAISNMQAAVGRVGANFIAAIFGDPLSTTEGPGAMAESINNVTARIEGLNQWVVANKDEIRGFFTDAAGAAKDLAGAVGSVAGFLKEHPALVQTAATAYVAFKAANVIGSVATLGSSLTGIGRDLDSMPGKADKAARGINTAFSLIVVPAIGKMLNDEIDAFLQDRFPGLDAANHAFTPDQLGKSFRDWFDRNVLGQNPSANGAPSGVGALPGASGTWDGQTPSVGGIPIPGLQQGGFTNPNNEDTGGKLTTATQNVQSYLRNTLGFGGTIGGYRPPDGFNEHSSGKASDVMVSSAAEGNALLPNLLRQPGVEYILWQQKTWYPNGTSKGMEDRGSPTQNHMDHLHVKTYDTGGWLPPGITPVNNATGQHELILNPEQQKLLQEQGIDPNSLLQGKVDPNTTQHGQAQGAPPGPQPNPSNRTGGYIPATAGNTAPVGQGGLSSILNVGQSFFDNLIDTGAQAASMAATAAAGAASFGAGAAAGPAASTAIQMGAQALKRLNQYGFDMAGIWGEAIPEILMPFGVPRWIGQVNPMAFVPQTPTQQPGQQPGSAAAQAIQGWAQPGNPAMANGTGQEGAQAALAQAKQQPSYQTAPQQTPPPTDPISALLKPFGVFDNGGWLPPGGVGVNLSNRPEAVFTGQQFRDMSKMATAWETGTVKSGGDTYQFYAQDVEGMFREYQKNKRRESRQYAGRP